MPNNFTVGVENTYRPSPSVPGWLSAIPYLGSAISAVNSLFSRDKSQELMDKQFAYNVQMWNMQNQYNTPVNQSARLKAAGFNPMFYGPDGNTAQQLSPVDVAGASNAAATQEQVRLQKEQQALQTAQNIANIELTKAEASKARAEAKVQQNSVQDNIDIIRSTYHSLLKDIEQKDASALATRIQNILTANSLGYKGVRFNGYSDLDTLDMIMEDYNDYPLSDTAKHAVEMMQREFNARISRSIAEVGNLNASALASKMAAAVNELDIDFFKKYHMNRSDSLIGRLIVGALKKFGVDITFE